MTYLSPLAKAKSRATNNQQAALHWLLLQLGANTHPMVMVEVGVFCGRTPQTLIPQLPLLHYIGVDPYLPWGEEPGYFILAEARQQALKVIAGQPRARLLEVPSATAVNYLGDGTLDLVFIDASHEYKAARGEIESWLPKVRNGGIVCGHDLYFQQGVNQAVDDIFGTDDYNYVAGNADVWWVQK